MSNPEQPWSITENLGATAFLAASARAMESAKPDGLIQDAYAGKFIEAVRSQIDLPTEVPANDSYATSISTLLGVRTRFFDGFLNDATTSGIRQIVLLAAGLDSRPQRLSWPSGTTIFELDQREILEFKETVLAEEKCRSGDSRLVPVGADLAGNWTAVLLNSGFDGDVPTTWLAEGLLPYLAVESRAGLLARLSELSPAGSRVALDDFGDTAQRNSQGSVRSNLDSWARTRATNYIFGTGQKSPMNQLTELGWQATKKSVVELARNYGRHDSEAELAGIDLITAIKGG